jgi:hypothetical protein
MQNLRRFRKDEKTKPGLARAALLGVIFFVLATGFFGVQAARCEAGELALSPQVTAELNQVLKVGDALHKSLLSQDEEQIEMGVRDIIVQLDRAKNASNQVKPHDRRHLLRVLDSAYEQFEQTQAEYGERRRVRLEEGFNQLVNIVRIYRVDRSYGIFFCPKDRTTWVQRGQKPQNPFRSIAESGHREPCGMRVPR